MDRKKSTFVAVMTLFGVIFTLYYLGDQGRATSIGRPAWLAMTTDQKATFDVISAGMELIGGNGGMIVSLVLATAAVLLLGRWIAPQVLSAAAPTAGRPQAESLLNQTLAWFLAIAIASTTIGYLSMTAIIGPEIGAWMGERTFAAAFTLIMALEFFAIESEKGKEKNNVMGERSPRKPSLPVFTKALMISALLSCMAYGHFRAINALAPRNPVAVSYVKFFGYIGAVLLVSVIAFFLMGMLLWRLVAPDPRSTEVNDQRANGNP